MTRNESITSYILGSACGLLLELVGWLYLIQVTVQLLQLLFRWLTGNPANVLVRFGHALLGVTGTRWLGDVLTCLVG